MTDLIVDGDRLNAVMAGDIPETGILVRAKLDEGWAPHDISVLDTPSLLAWLRSRGGKNEWAENCVGMLLGHEKLVIDGEQ